MKTYVLGFIALGLTNLMIAQNNIVALTSSNTSLYSKSKSAKNMDYLNMTNTEDISNKIKNIQKLVANYDIKNAEVYQSKGNSTYNVTFREGGNTVAAVYDNDGKLIRCKENYQAIRLPHAVSLKIAKDYPGWVFDSIKCDIIYTKDNGSSISYHVIIKQGRKSKRITITI